MNSPTSQAMLPLNRKERDLENHRYLGLVEHSHHPLRCSACGEDLLDVMVVQPQIDVEFRFRADCPHCGDHSFLTPPIRGGTCIGTTADPARTVYRAADVEDGTVYLRTAKGPAA